MDRTLLIAAGLAVALATPTFARPGLGGGGAAPPKPDWNAIADPVKAAQVAVRDVCMPAVLNGQAVETVAKAARWKKIPPKTVQAGKADKVWQVGSIARVYVVARVDGSCAALADSGPLDLMWPPVEAAILQRPEGFARRQSVSDGGLDRATYCAAGDPRFAISIVTAAAGSPRGTQVLAATVSRNPPANAGCNAGPATS